MPTSGPRLVMVGTIHLYEEAREKLRSILEELRPAIITVEISRFSIEFRENSRRIWTERFNLALSRIGVKQPLPPVLELLRRQISMPYEWTVSEEYGGRYGVRVVPIDTSALSRRELPSWERQFLNENNLWTLLKSSDLEDLEEGHFGPLKMQAITLMKDGMRHDTPAPIHPLSWLGDPFWQERERVLSKRLARIASICHRVVHVGGWMHCVEDSPWPTLVDLLKGTGMEVEVKCAF